MFVTLSEFYPLFFRERRVSEEILEILHSIPKGIATAAHQTDIYLVFRQPEYLVRAIPQDFLRNP